MKKVFGILAILGASVMALTSCKESETNTVTKQIDYSVEKNDEGIIVCENCEIYVYVLQGKTIDFEYQYNGPTNHCEFKKAKLIQYNNFFEIYVSHKKFIFSNELVAYSIRIEEDK